MNRVVYIDYHHNRYPLDKKCNIFQSKTVIKLITKCYNPNDK